MKIYKYLAAFTISVGLMQSAYSSPWPSGVTDNFTVNTGQRVYIPVLENDSGDSLSLTEVNTTTVALGSAQIDVDQKAVYYTSASGFTGDDSFWYAFKDSLGRTNAAQVILKVISPVPNDTPVPETPSDDYENWPTATVDHVTTPKNTAVTVSVLANDIGDRLSLTDLNAWSANGGSTSIQGDSILYRPKVDYVGEDTFWYRFVDARGRTNSTQAKITVTDHNTDVNPDIAVNATPIFMHVDFLKNQPFVWGEVGGTQSMKVTQAASAGSSQLKVRGGFTLKDNQLITYRATDGEYYTVATGQSQNKTINLRTALPAPIAQSATIWNFYNDGSHPNAIGFRSLVDFALRNNDVSALDFGKHVMLGDSWFSYMGVEERLSEKLNSAHIINKGVGGHTTAMLLERFDRDVSNENPDVVWLMAGTNDYYQGVSVEVYAANMKQLIEKINALGAKAMVFDSSVAPLMSGSSTLTEKSHRYAEALADLLNR